MKRFVTNLINELSHERLGILRSAWYYYINHEIKSEDEEELNDLFGWFNDFLIVPSKVSRSKKKNGIDIATKRSISWFKDSAELHIKKARQIAEILKNNNVEVELLTTKNPGYITYEDEYQVAAIPLRR